MEDIGLDVYASGIHDTRVLSDSDIQGVVRSASNSDSPLHSEVYHRLLQASDVDQLSISDRHQAKRVVTANHHAFSAWISLHGPTLPGAIPSRRHWLMEGLHGMDSR